MPQIHERVKKIPQCEFYCANNICILFKFQPAGSEKKVYAMPSRGEKSFKSELQN